MTHRSNRYRIAPLIALAASTFAGQAVAQDEIVYYDSMGFETPDYVQDTLPGYTFSQGQDLWVAIAFDGAVDRHQMKVQNQVVHEGQASVAFFADGHEADRPELFRGTFYGVEHRFMQVDLDLRIDTAATTGTGEWLVVNQQSAMTGLHMIGFLEDGRIRVLDYSTGQMVYAESNLDRDAWHHMRILFDYENNTATYYLDAEEIFTDVTTVAILGSYGLFGVFADFAGDDVFYMDNLRIINVSEFQDCIPDWNGDGNVNSLDFIAYLNDWGDGAPEADINGDGQINTLDFIAFLNLWNTGC